MKNINEIEDDLITLFLDGKIDAGLHAANCFCTMGAGIALEVKRRIPQVYEMDCLTVKGNPKKLGQFTCYENERGQVFASIYSQYKYGRDKRYTDYDALLNGLVHFSEYLLKLNDKKWLIGIPYKMGSVNAGGDWKIVLDIIKYVFGNNDKFEILIVRKL